MSTELFESHKTELVRMVSDFVTRKGILDVGDQLTVNLSVESKPAEVVVSCNTNIPSIGCNLVDSLPATSGQRYRLKRHLIFTFGQLTRICEEDLLRIENFGPCVIRKIGEKMKAHGLAFGQNIPLSEREKNIIFSQTIPNRIGPMFFYSCRSVSAGNMLVSVGDLVTAKREDLLSMMSIDDYSVVQDVIKRMGV